MKTRDLIELEKQTAIARAKEDNRLDIWPFYSSTHDFKYSPKTGHDFTKIIQTAKQVIIRGEYGYYAERKQAVNNYCIRVIDLSTGKTDLIHYSGNLKQAMKIIATIATDKDNINPEIMKNRYYNGSGSDQLSWCI